jgi:hypothetical protein
MVVAVDLVRHMQGVQVQLILQWALVALVEEEAVQEVPA